MKKEGRVEGPATENHPTFRTAHHTPIHPSTHPTMHAPHNRSPGVFDTMARALRPVIMLIRLDLPTFERPMTAGQ